MLIAYTALVAGATLLLLFGVVAGILHERTHYVGADIPGKTVRRWMFGVAVVILLSVPLFAQQ